MKRADERTRTADLISLRISSDVFPALAGVRNPLTQAFRARLFLPQVNPLHRRVTVRLSSNCFGQDFLGPAQSRVGSRETDGCEGEDDVMQDLRLRNADAEQLAHMRTHGAF